MGFYSDARKVAYLDGHLSMLDTVSDYVKKLEDTGEHQFSIEDMRAFVDCLGSASAAAPENNRSESSKQ